VPPGREREGRKEKMKLVRGGESRPVVGIPQRKGREETALCQRKKGESNDHPSPDAEEGEERRGKREGERNS